MGLLVDGPTVSSGAVLLGGVEVAVLPAGGVTSSAPQPETIAAMTLTQAVLSARRPLLDTRARCCWCWRQCTPQCLADTYRAGVQDTSARLVAVSVVAALRTDEGRSPRRTAIDKQPVAGQVAVGVLGVAGDKQLNRKHHGGPDKAVYAFAREDVVHWERELSRPIPPGSFGENFSTLGLDVSDSLVGERWRVGSGDDALVVEVTMPRQPCMTFARWIGEGSGWVRRFSAYGRVGAYLRVIFPGTVGAGDPITVVHEPAHGVPVSAVLAGLDNDQACALLDAEAHGAIELSPPVSDRARRVLAPDLSR